MNVAAIITAVISFMQAVPKVVDLVNKFYKLWVDKELQKQEKDKVDIDEKRAVIIRAISKAETKEDRRVLSLMLQRFFE